MANPDRSIFVKPVGDRKVRDPRTMQHVRAEGQLVPFDSYWYRRQADGDVEILEAAPASDAPAVVKELKK